MIVDGHCHAGTGDGFTGPWDTRAPLGDYLRRARAAGIARSVVFAAFAGDYASANAEVAEICRAHAPRLIGFAFVHAKRDAGRVGVMVEEAVHAYGFRGIKVHGIDAPITREVFDAARRFGIPILYDVAGKTEILELIVPEYPDVDVIVPHLGSFADDWRAHQRLIDQMMRLPNLYTDTAGTRRFDYVVQAIRRLGPRRVIFGSDGPWLHPGLELHKIRLLGLPPEAEREITGGNVLRLLRRERAPARRFGWVPHTLAVR
ncbi:MAG: amidohydrolase family protein [Candidatus Eremiobacteraeota bacterium]|nr:amidohydrolase family protein [Candidatus Eremiobacteraeota bacterium]